MTYSDELKEKIIELFKQGYTKREVAKITGVPPTTCYYIWRRSPEYQKRKQYYDTDKFQLALKLYNEGYPIVQIAKKIGCNRMTIERWIKGTHKPRLHYEWEPEKTPELAAVIGTLIARGYLREKKGKEGLNEYIIGLSSKNYKIVEEFNINLAKVLKRKPNKIIKRKHDKQYVIEYKSVNFYQWWKKRKPYENLDILREIVEQNKESINAFINAILRARITKKMKRQIKNYIDQLIKTYIQK